MNKNRKDKTVAAPRIMPDIFELKYTNIWHAQTAYNITIKMHENEEALFLWLMLDGKLDTLGLGIVQQSA
jgi:hypothetical protein